MYTLREVPQPVHKVSIRDGKIVEIPVESKNGAELPASVKVFAGPPSQVLRHNQRQGAKTRAIQENMLGNPIVRISQ